MNDIVFLPLGNTPIDARAERIADVDPRLTRTNYFDGRLLTADDLIRDQIYLDQRLREVGEVLGDGVIRGLEVRLDAPALKLYVQPGLAVTPAGRVLELGRTLEVDFGNRALISRLNNGAYRRFRRALYAVVIRYVEVGTDIAEVFPTDLGEQRGFQFDTTTEAVQVGLVPLPSALPAGSEIGIRARLMRELLANDFESLIPEDGVALGVLAVSDDLPRWLDGELLRHPLRNALATGSRQGDLSRQYEALLRSVMTDRSRRGLNGDFAAASYFPVLPPAGSLPREAFDPENGRQGFFPESYPVWIAPVRMSDVDLLKSESMALPVIDLSVKEPVEVVALVPLSNQDFGRLAPGLERTLDAAPRRLPHLDLLRLRLHPMRPVHTLDTDSGIWRAIWEATDQERLFYVRRPVRAAETSVSSIVLALGTTVPDGPPPAETPADFGGLLEDEESVLLRYLSFDTLLQERPPEGSAGVAAAEDIEEEFGGDAPVVRAAMRILLHIERAFDDIVWQTLLALARGETLLEFADRLTETGEAEQTTPERVVEIGRALGLDESLLTQWTAMDA